MGWATLYREKMKIVTDYLTKPHYSNKQDTISFFVSHGPQILTTSAYILQFQLGKLRLSNKVSTHFCTFTLLQFYTFTLSMFTVRMLR